MSKRDEAVNLDRINQFGRPGGLVLLLAVSAGRALLRHFGHRSDTLKV